MSTLVALIVDQIFAGLVQDIDLSRAVLLSLLDEYMSGHDSQSPSEGLVVLQGCLNRLILFA